MKIEFESERDALRTDRDRWDRLREAYKTGVYTDQFTTTMDMDIDVFNLWMERLEKRNIKNNENLS